MGRKTSSVVPKSISKIYRLRYIFVLSLSPAAAAVVVIATAICRLLRKKSITLYLVIHLGCIGDEGGGRRQRGREKEKGERKNNKGLHCSQQTRTLTSFAHTPVWGELFLKRKSFPVRFVKYQLVPDPIEPQRVKELVRFLVWKKIQRRFSLGFSKEKNVFGKLTHSSPRSESRLNT